MRILFHVEPLVMHSRPFHYWAWLERTAIMGRALSERGWSCRWALNAALATRAVAAPDEAPPPRHGHGLPREQVVVFEQQEIRGFYEAPNVAILDGLQHGRWPQATLERHAAHLRGRFAPFEPEVIVTYTPSDALAAAWPDALILHSENGAFSRAPGPATQFFDPLGLYERSMPARLAGELQGRAPDGIETAFLGVLREGLAAHHEATTPFTALESKVRAAGAVPVLLPLQFGGEAGFDLNAPFRNQGEYLLHVLEQAGPGFAVLIAQHPSAAWLGEAIDEETRDWLAAACPQAVFVPDEAAPFVGQALLPHVDAVLGVSSSLGWQALVWRKPLVAVGRGHLARWADGHDVAELPAVVRQAPRDHDGALAWLFRHYFVPDRCWTDGDWLDVFLRRGAERWHAGVRGLAFYEPSEPLSMLQHATRRELAKATRRALRQTEREAQAA